MASPRVDDIEFHSMKERWGVISGVNMFLYTHVIFKSRSEYYTARVPGRYASPQDLPVVEPCLLQAIDSASIWPSLQPGLVVCPRSDKAGLHVKTPRLVDFDGSPALGQHLLHEARVCQALTRTPHPNIIRFHGCDVVGGPGREVITGLCFEECTETLADRIRNGFSIDADRCIAQVRAGVEHLHTMNLVHNDITADTVMFKTFGPLLVIADFESCAFRGYTLPAKHGPVPAGTTTSEFENDLLGIELLYNLLLKHEKEMESRS